MYKIVPALAKQSFNLKMPLKLLVASYHSESTRPNQSIEDWIKSLAADKQQRVKWIRNEVFECPICIIHKQIILFCQIDASNQQQCSISCLVDFVAKFVILHCLQIALKATESGKIPRLEQLTIADYEEMIEMSNSRRQRFYNYLHQTKSADYHDEVSQKHRILFKQSKLTDCAV